MNRPQDLYPPFLEVAARLAARGHHPQFRKQDPGKPDCDPGGRKLPGDCIPYITHPMGVMTILARTGASDQLLAAALLHDYLEDVDDPDGPSHIREACGEDVLKLVEAVSENKRREFSARKTWQARKQETVEHLAHMAGDAVRLKTADLLHNLLSLIADIRNAEDPRKVWERFNARKEQQLRHFHSVLDAASRRLGETDPLILALKQSIEDLESLSTSEKSV